MSEPLATSRRAVVGSLLGLALGAAKTADSRAAEKPAALAPLPVAAARAEGNAPFPVIIEVDASATLGELKPIWRFFGADEPNYATHRDGKTLVAELGELSPHPTPLYKKKASEAAGHSGHGVFFRTHNLLTTGDGAPALKWGSTNAYTEDAAGNPIYDWTILDQIFDTYLERGVRPYVQIGFMPKALSIKPDPYQHHWTPQARYDEIYTGWAYPPKDYAKWGELAYQWTRHCVDRYGRAEVEKWYWEVWNEPNIGYWRGTAEEFRKLHDFALDGVRRALPTARVGGCDSAGGGGPFLRDFIEHSLRGTNFATGQTGTPLQFVSFHAKGAPTYIPAPAGTEGTGHVRMGISNQLRTIDSTFGLIASYPELRDAPLVIGESDPDGCAACQGPQLGYRNTTMYSSYTAASFARKHLLAAKHQVNLEGALTWAFEFEDAPLFAGYRVLATGGIDLPVLNVFRMFSRMGSERISSSSSAMTPLEEIVARGVRGERPDVGVLASRIEKRVAVLVWHYHDDDLPGPDALIALSLAGLPAGRRKSKSAITHWRIDHEHSNSYTAFQKMGSPLTPTADQYAALKAAGQLEQLKEGLSTQPASNADGLSLSFRLPRQGISLIEIEV